MKKFMFISLVFIGILAGLIFSQLNPMPDEILIGEKEAQPLVLNTQPLPENTPITRLLVIKSKRQMWAYNQETLVKIYPIALGGSPIGHKQFEGDKKTPEGIYRINERNPNSAYHKNLGISYPNVEDKAYALSQGKSPGGLIKIHGLSNKLFDIGRQHLRKDWTNGCIAVTNEEIDELFKAVVDNAEIDIRP